MKKISYTLLIIIICTRLQACLNFKNAKPVETDFPEQIIYSNTDEEFIQAAKTRFELLTELIKKSPESTSPIKEFCNAIAKEIANDSYELIEISTTYKFNKFLIKSSFYNGKHYFSKLRFLDQYIFYEKKFQSLFESKAYSDGNIEIRAYALKTLSYINSNIVYAEGLKRDYGN